MQMLAESCASCVVRGPSMEERWSGRSDMESSYRLGRLARVAGSGVAKGCELRGLKSVTPVDVTDLVRSGVYEKEAIIVSSDNFNGEL